MKNLTKRGHKIVIGITAISLVIVGIYSILFNNALSEANTLYSQEKYREAYDRMKGFLIPGNDDVERIRFANDAWQDYWFYEHDPDYERKFHWLLSGIEDCVNDEVYTLFHKADTDVKKSALNDVKKLYLEELLDVFDISEIEAIEIVKLSRDEWDNIYYKLDSENHINKN